MFKLKYKTRAWNFSVVTGLKIVKSKPTTLGADHRLRRFWAIPCLDPMQLTQDKHVFPHISAAEVKHVPVLKRPLVVLEILLIW